MMTWIFSKKKARKVEEPAPTIEATFCKNERFGVNWQSIHGSDTNPWYYFERAEDYDYWHPCHGSWGKCPNYKRSKPEKTITETCICGRTTTTTPSYLNRPDRDTCANYDPVVKTICKKCELVVPEVTK